MSETFNSYGIIPTTLEGLVSNSVASAPMTPLGERPLANTVPIGTRFVARDSNYVGISGAHPKLRNQRIWYTPQNARTDTTATAGAGGVTLSRLGVYNPTTRVFTQASVSGQFCNARAIASVGAGATVSVSIAIGSILVVVGASNLAIGDEVMSDGTGLLVPYVNNGVNIPVGISPNFIATGSTVSILQYDW